MNVTYLPLDSFFNRLDPRTKVVAMFAVLIAVFIPTGWFGLISIGIILVICILASKLSIKYIWKSVRPMLFMMAFLLVVNIFVVKTGTVLLTIGSFKIYSDALTQTLYVVVRILLMIMTTTLLTATTKPTDLTMALEDLMMPLEKIKVPTHDIAMMVSLALRFIPTLVEEAQRIMKAQASRGVDLENGNFKEKISAIISLIVPMFIACFQRADDLADAMDARGYVVGAKRVRYRQLQFHFRDIVVIVCSCLILAIMIVVAIVW